MNLQTVASNASSHLAERRKPLFLNANWKPAFIKKRGNATRRIKPSDGWSQTHDLPSTLSPLVNWSSPDLRSTRRYYQLECGRIFWKLSTLIDPLSRLLVYWRSPGGAPGIASYVLLHALKHQGSLTILFSKENLKYPAIKNARYLRTVTAFYELHRPTDSDTTLFALWVGYCAKAATDRRMSYQASYCRLWQWQDMNRSEIWLNAKPWSTTAPVHRIFTSRSRTE